MVDARRTEATVVSPDDGRTRRAGRAVPVDPLWRVGRRGRATPSAPGASPAARVSAELQSLAKERADAYRRVVQVARDGNGDDSSNVMSWALVAAIDGDADLGRKAKDLAMKLANGPIRSGHVPFAYDLALGALAYDLCHESWSEAERRKFHEYVNRTVNANVQSETSVFHNGWYGYKNWGIGLACYATYYENPRAKEILKSLAEEYRTRAAPALELSGNGGGFGEGYYLHYWLYEWLFFCEAARRCEGVDYYAMAPSFFKNRAIASMFEMYPGIEPEYRSRRPGPDGRWRRPDLRRRPRQGSVRPANPGGPLPR